MDHPHLLDEVDASTREEVEEEGGSSRSGKFVVEESRRRGGEVAEQIMISQLREWIPGEYHVLAEASEGK